MGRRFIRRLSRRGDYQEDIIKGKAFELRPQEKELSLTLIPDELEGQVLQEFLESYWAWTAEKLDSGDRAALAMITDQDVNDAGLEPARYDLDEDDLKYGELHHVLDSVRPAQAEFLAGRAAEHGLLRCHVKGGQTPKEAPQTLRSEHYRSFLRPET